MELPIQICHRCDRRQRPCAGKCVCLESQEDIQEHAAQNICPLGKFGSSPDTSLAKKWWRGVIGIAKVTSGIGHADNVTVAKRRATCRNCPEVTVVAGILKTCGKCGCGLAAKTLVASESCPIGKWLAVSACAK